MTIWLWDGKRFVNLDCGETFEAVILKLGWEPTRSAAQKAIQRGEYKWRKVPQAENRVQDWKEPIPVGWPIAILKHKPFARWAEVMIPLERQGRRSWTRIWNEQPIGFWADRLDKIENWMRRTLRWAFPPARSAAARCN